MHLPQSSTLGRLLLDQAETYGQGLALVAEDRTYSYRELATAALSAAHGLQRLGIQPGDSVGLLAPNLPEWPITAFGALMTGARVHAFNTWAKAWDLEYLLDRSQARVLVTADRAGSNDLLAELGKLLPEAWRTPPGHWRSVRFPHVDHLIAIGDDTPRGALNWTTLTAASSTDAHVDDPASGDPAFVLYTSGSTAYPKAVPLAHRPLIENGFHIGERMGLTDQDRVWLASPLFWSYGAANALMATTTHGACLTLQRQFEPHEAARLLQEHRCTAAYLIPSITDALAAKAGPEVRAVSSLRTGLTIGRPDEVRRAAEDLGIEEICNVYGSTETYGNCCVTRYDLPLEMRLETQGQPLPGVEIRVVDPDTGAVRNPGEGGELEVRGRITPGYLDDPEATAKVIAKGGWFRTGDRAHIDESGFLYFTGRATEMIKTSGINVSPAEVERFLVTHPDVTGAAVVGAPHSVKGEVVVAFVTTPTNSNLTCEDLIGYCKEAIAGYKVPWDIVIWQELPRTSTGKLHRKTLLETAAARVAERGGSQHDSRGA